MSRFLKQVSSTSRVRRFEIGEPEHGMRIDQFLAMRIPEISRNRIQKVLRERVWTSSKTEVSCSTRLRAGEVVFARFPYPKETLRPYTMNVLYEDDELLAIDKPAGALVHPTPKERINSVIMMLRHQRGEGYLTLVHRLDRETSGVLLLAKTPRAAQQCGEQLYFKNMRKIYLARIHGHLPQNEGVIDSPIGNADWSRVHIRGGVVASGKPSTTRYRVIRREESSSLVELQPLTGRNHQLRIHMESVGCPIVGDQLYGQSDDHFLDFIESDRPAPRLHLHAMHLSGNILGRPIQIESPKPDFYPAQFLIGAT